jgi:hypothetical protein
VRGWRHRLALGPLGRFLASLGQQAVEIGRRDALQDAEVGLRQLGRLVVPKQRHALAVGVVFLRPLGRPLGHWILRPFLRLIPCPIERPIVPGFGRASGPLFAPPLSSITRSSGRPTLPWTLAFRPSWRIA